MRSENFKQALGSYSQVLGRVKEPERRRNFIKRVVLSEKYFHEHKFVKFNVSKAKIEMLHDNVELCKIQILIVNILQE
jgi:hypothetical protein